VVATTEAGGLCEPVSGRTVGEIAGENANALKADNGPTVDMLKDVGSEGKTGAAERRIQVRHSVHLPVKITFFASPLVERPSIRMAAERASVRMMAAARPSGRASAERSPAGASTPPGRGLSDHAPPNEPVVVHAFAVDISERGMKVEIAAAPLRSFLEASDPLVQVVVTFTHPDLRSLGPRPGHVQWRRAGGERNTWELGARFDTVIEPDEMNRIIRVGRVGRPEESRRSNAVPIPLLLVSGLALALVGIGWYRSQSADAAERERLEQRLSHAEDELSDLKAADERCRTELNARVTLVAVAAPKAEPPAPAHAPAAPQPASRAPSLDLKGAAPASDEPSAGLAAASDAKPARIAVDAAAEE
jgi:hypothetical protein